MHEAPAIRRWAVRLGLAVIVAIAIGYVPGQVLRRDPRAVKLEQQLDELRVHGREVARRQMRALARDVEALQSDVRAIEDRARADLGMVVSRRDRARGASRRREAGGSAARRRREGLGRRRRRCARVRDRRRRRRRWRGAARPARPSLPQTMAVGGGARRCVVTAVIRRVQFTAAVGARAARVGVARGGDRPRGSRARAVARRRHARRDRGDRRAGARRAYPAALRARRVRDDRARAARRDRDASARRCVSRRRCSCAAGISRADDHLGVACTRSSSAARQPPRDLLRRDLAVPRPRRAKRLDDELDSLRESARDYRLIAAALGPGSRAPRPRDEEERLLAIGGVGMIGDATSWVLATLKRSLGARTVALLWVDDDGERVKLKEVESDADDITEAPRLPQCRRARRGAARSPAAARRRDQAGPAAVLQHRPRRRRARRGPDHRGWPPARHPRRRSRCHSSPRPIAICSPMPAGRCCARCRPSRCSAPSSGRSTNTSGSIRRPRYSAAR